MSYAEERVKIQRLCRKLVAEVSMNSDSRILRGELEFFPDKLVVDLTIYQLLGIPFFRFLFINVVFLKNY